MRRKKCGPTSAARLKRQASAARSARPLRGEEEIKTKIDLSHISRPGDVLQSDYAEEGSRGSAATKAAPAAAHPPVVAKPVVAPPVARPSCSSSSSRAARNAASSYRAAGAACGRSSVSRSLPCASAPTCSARVPRRPAPPVSCRRCTTGSRRSSFSLCRAAARSSGRAASCRATVSRVPPQPPAPRMIVPQTGPRPGIQGSAAASCPPAAQLQRPAARYASRARTSRARSADFSAPASGRRREDPVERVRRCVPASDVRCIPRVQAPQGRVRLVWARAAASRTGSSR